MGRIKNLLSAGIIGILALGFTACDDPALLLQQLELDVMTANALFLEVVSITPQANTALVDPGADILIEFDRPIDMSTLSDSFLLVDDDGVGFESEVAGKSLNFSFNEVSNILTVSADPYFEGLKSYTVSLLDQIRGIDGSSLKEGLSWNFSTKDVPRGSISPVKDYSNVTTVELEINSQASTYYAISTDKSSLGRNSSWVEITSSRILIDDFIINGTPGENKIFILFRDGDIGDSGIANLSMIEEASIIYDTTEPVVSFSSSDLYSNQNSVQLSGNVSDNYEIESYLWEETDGSSLALGSDDSLNATASVSNDGVYTLKLTVTDMAGNSGSADLVFTRDTIPPELSVGSSSIYTKSDTSFSISSTVADPGEIENYSWEFVSGNGSVDITDSKSSSTTARVSTEGSYSIKIIATDKAGNTSEKTITVTCSDSGPQVSLPQSLYYTDSSFSVEAEEDLGGLSGTGRGWTKVSGPGTVTFSDVNDPLTTISVSLDGQYTVRYSLTTAAGTASADATVYWDTTAPSVNAGSGTLYATASNGSPSLSGSASDGTSGIESVSWSFVSGPGSVLFGNSGSTSTTVSPSTDGSYVVRLTATDNAGNSNSSTRTVIRDTVAPSSPTVSVSTYTSDRTPTFSVTAGSGGINSFRYSIDGASWKTSGSTVSPSLPYGYTPVAFQGRDTAGNWSSSKTTNVLVYPANSYSPLNKSTGFSADSDLVWDELGNTSYYYLVEIGTSSRSLSAIGSYRSLPYVDSSELNLASYTTYYWRVSSYTRSLIGGKFGYTYTLVSTGSALSFTTGYIPFGKF